jgi:hypothetical protein
MGPCDTELLCCHSRDHELSKKYEELLPSSYDDEDVYMQISLLVEKYKGKTCLTRPEKGFCHVDIRYFLSI